MATSPMLVALLGAEKGAKAVKNAKTLQAVPSAPAGAPAVPPALPKPPSHAKRLKDDMQYTKRRATERWVNGDINSKQHAAIHARADSVMREPQKFVKPAKKGRR